MLVTPSGMVTDVKPLQSRKAELPMLVTLSGMVTDVKPLQYAKAELPMLVPPVMITSFNEVGTYLELSLELDAPNIYPKCVFAVPFFVAPTKGIVMDVKPVQL